MRFFGLRPQNDRDDKEMIQTEFKILDHLEELRRRLMIVLISSGFFSILCFFFSDSLLNIVIFPIQKNVYSLYFLSPYEAFMTKLKLSVVCGAIISLPVIFYQLWKFVSPGLYFSERQKVLPLVVVSTALFLIGALFAYFGVIPFALNFFLNFQTESLEPLISIGSYLSFFLSFIFIFGIVFELPVLLIGLMLLGVVKPEFLRAQRRVAVVAIFVLAAVLTPTVDLITQFLLAIPLWILFELSILLGKQIEKRI